MDEVNAPDELTRRLVDEGARLLVENGPGGLSLRRLATAAGTSTMAVYTRFGDKQGLLSAMHREGFRRLGRQLTDALAAQSPGEPLAGLAALGRAYRTAALASPFLYDLMFGRAAAEFAPDAAGQAAARAAYDPLVAAVRRAVDAGVLRGDPERIAVHLWVVTHGMVSLELAGALDKSDERYAEALAFAAAPFIPPGT